MHLLKKPPKKLDKSVTLPVRDKQAIEKIITRDCVINNLINSLNNSKICNLLSYWVRRVKPMLIAMCPIILHSEIKRSIQRL